MELMEILVFGEVREDVSGYNRGIGARVRFRV